MLFTILKTDQNKAPKVWPVMERKILYKYDIVLDFKYVVINVLDGGIVCIMANYKDRKCADYRKQCSEHSFAYNYLRQ